MLRISFNAVPKADPDYAERNTPPEPRYCILTESEVCARWIYVHRVGSTGRLREAVRDGDGNRLMLPVHADERTFHEIAELEMAREVGRFAFVARDHRGRHQARRDFWVYRDDAQRAHLLSWPTPLEQTQADLAETNRLREVAEEALATEQARREEAEAALHAEEQRSEALQRALAEAITLAEDAQRQVAEVAEALEEAEQALDELPLERDDVERDTALLALVARGEDESDDDDEPYDDDPDDGEDEPARASAGYFEYVEAAGSVLDKLKALFDVATRSPRTTPPADDDEPSDG